MGPNVVGSSFFCTRSIIYPSLKICTIIGFIIEFIVDSLKMTILCLTGNMLCILENAEMEVRYPDIQFWARASDPVLARDAFSSLMWILFCLPGPFLSCEESFLSLVHIFYVVSVTQVVRVIHLYKRHIYSNRAYSFFKKYIVKML